MKKIAILGSTGSIGTQTLAVADEHSDIEIVAKEVRVLSEAETPPFPIEENSKTKEECILISSMNHSNKSDTVALIKEALARRIPENFGERLITGELVTEDDVKI